MDIHRNLSKLYISNLVLLLRLIKTGKEKKRRKKTIDLFSTYLKTYNTSDTNYIPKIKIK